MTILRQTLESRLVADLGGTNGRVALTHEGLILSSGVIEAPVRTKAEALALFWQCLKSGGTDRLVEAVIAAAGPVDGDVVTLTNGGWSFSATALRRELALSRIVVVNDFVAVALCVPYLATHDVRQVGCGATRTDGPIVVLGPGTGLGVASLVPTATGAYVVPGEGGHTTISSANEFDAKIIDLLRDDDIRDDGQNWFGHVSAERILSGAGLTSLCRVIHRLAGVTCTVTAPHEVTARAAQGDDLGIRTLEAFCSMMGTFAGNVALTLGATGGVYIAGGIVPRFADFFVSPASGFRSAFEGNGRLSAYLKKVPTFLITRKHPAILGLARMGGLVPTSAQIKPVFARGYEA